MKIAITFTEQELTDLLDTAQTRCGYWAQTRVDLREAIKRPVRIYDAEEPKKLQGVLTRKKFSPLVVDAESNPGIFKALENMDSLAADYIVQLALFGEERYA